jgi:hypothetical protein
MSDTVTTPPVTTQPDPPRHSRRFRILRAAGISFAGLVVVSAIGGALEGPQAEPAANPAPAVSTSAPAPRPAVTVTARPKPAVTVTAKPRPAVTVTATAPAAPAPATTAPSTKSLILSWYGTGGGQGDVSAVESDLSSIATDAGTQDASAVETDASQLSTDAASALTNPPPVASVAGPYDRAMTLYETAGSDAADGDFTDASTDMEIANAEIGTATAAIKSLT